MTDYRKVPSILPLIPLHFLKPYLWTTKQLYLPHSTPSFLPVPLHPLTPTLPAHYGDHLLFVPYPLTTTTTSPPSPLPGTHSHSNAKPSFLHQSSSLQALTHSTYTGFKFLLFYPSPLTFLVQGTISSAPRLFYFSSSSAD